MIVIIMSHAQTMNRVYRFQRHLYDVTRPLFLFGRDDLLDAMALDPGMRVLELGCGTARNLIRLARRHPEAQLFGVDISEEMLRTARSKIAKRGFSSRIVLVESPAETVHFRTTFSLDRPFDVIFSSYALSMMPDVQATLDAAKRSLAPDGSFYAVDFLDGNGWPKPLKQGFGKWLSLFHVQFDVGIETLIADRFENTQIRPIKGRYAFLTLPGKG